MWLRIAQRRLHEIIAGVTTPDTLPDDVAALHALVLSARAERDAERAEKGRVLEERDQLAGQKRRRDASWRIIHGETDNITPKVAVILIGTDDIGWLYRAAADTVADIDALVADLHLRLPATKILLVGVLPSDRSTSVCQATAGINFALVVHYSNGQVPYVAYRDVSSAFFKYGVLDTSLFSNPQTSCQNRPCTPSSKGQERMAAALEPTLSELLGDARHDG